MLTIQDIADTFNAQGIDTTEKLSAWIERLAGFDDADVTDRASLAGLLNMAKLQMLRNGKLLAIAALQGEAATARQTIEDRRQALEAEVAAMTAQINAATQ